MLVPMYRKISGSWTAAASRSSRWRASSGSSRTYRPSRTTDSGGFTGRCAGTARRTSAIYLETGERGLGAVSTRDLGLNPARDLASQGLQRDRSVRKHLVMEGAHVEPLAHPSRDLVPCSLDLALAELVGQRLARPDRVSVDLDLRVDHGQRAPLVHEPNGAPAIPAHGVQPGI